VTPAPTVAVTGLGCVSAFGVGRTALAAGLAAAVPRLAPVDRSEGYHGPRGAASAALVRDLDTTPWIPPLEARRMSNPSRFAVVAAREALADAGLEVPAAPDRELAVALGTAFGPAAWTQRLLDQLFDEGPAAASPALFTESVLNAPAGRVALACRAAGPNHTLAQAEAGPLLACRRGAADVAHGRAGRALAGGVEEVTPLLHAALDGFGALAPAGADGSERAQPFDRRRDGFLAAEGAAVLLLEPEATARERGASILARLAGGCAAFDPTASRVGFGHDGETLARRLRRGLERLGLAVADLDLIVSGASGSPAGDRLEAAVLRHAWGNLPLPPIVAPKAITGEYGGLHLAAAVLLVAGLWSEGFPSLEDPDPACGVTLHTGSLAPGRRRALVSALAAGGAAAWLVLESP
jgi:3-oxoacyl-[acyl-carrier-protein] synthase II